MTLQIKKNASCFDDDNEKLVQDQINPSAKAVSGFQIIIISHSWNPKREVKKLNIHIHYLEKEEDKIKDIENSEHRNQRNREESNDASCFEKGNDLLEKTRLNSQHQMFLDSSSLC
jgi:hypothetical protein